MKAQDFYDNELSNYSLLNKIDPATAKQAMQMMEEYHQAKLKLLGIHNVSVSLPLKKLHQWCKEEGYKVDAELLVRSNSNVIKPIIVDCNSISSVKEFLEHISNER